MTVLAIYNNNKNMTSLFRTENYQYRQTHLLESKHQRQLPGRCCLLLVEVKSMKGETTDYTVAESWRGVAWLGGVGLAYFDGSVLPDASE